MKRKNQQRKKVEAINIEGKQILFDQIQTVKIRDDFDIIGFIFRLILRIVTRIPLNRANSENKIYHIFLFDGGHVKVASRRLNETEKERLRAIGNTHPFS